MNLREKIKDRLDELQRMIEMKMHLENPELVMEKLESVTKFWTALSEEEREFCESIKFSINYYENQKQIINR